MRVLKLPFGERRFICIQPRSENRLNYFLRIDQWLSLNQNHTDLYGQSLRIQAVQWTNQNLKQIHVEAKRGKNVWASYDIDCFRKPRRRRAVMMILHVRLGSFLIPVIWKTTTWNDQALCILEQTNGNSNVSLWNRKPSLHWLRSQLGLTLWFKRNDEYGGLTDKLKMTGARDSCIFVGWKENSFWCVFGVKPLFSNSSVALLSLIR